MGVISIMSENLDFSPCRLVELKEYSRSVALIFQDQPIYLDDGSVKRLSCQLVLNEAKLLESDLFVPLEAENLTIKYDSGERSCFFPLMFSETGPVEVLLEIDSKQTLIASGKEINLEILKTSKSI